MERNERVVEEKIDEPSDGMVPGAFVRVRTCAFRVRMSPNSLRKIGWPNGEFTVVSRGLLPVQGLPKKVDCLTLSPCCNFMKDPSTGKYLCSGHPTKLFEMVDIDKLDFDDDRKRPDSLTSINGPDGEIVSLNYYRDKNSSLILRGLSRKPISVSGVIADKLGDLLKEAGVL